MRTIEVPISHHPFTKEEEEEESLCHTTWHLHYATQGFHTQYNSRREIILQFQEHFSKVHLSMLWCTYYIISVTVALQCLNY